MKRSTITAIFVVAGFAAHAQSAGSWNLGPNNIMELMRGAAAILVLVLVGAFILYFTRELLDYRLKNKMIDSGVPDQIIAQISMSGKKDNRIAALKWFLLLAGLGVGLLLISLFPPLGLHSLMILAFCISLSFYLYYFFTRKQSL